MTQKIQETTVLAYGNEGRLHCEEWVSTFAGRRSQGGRILGMGADMEAFRTSKGEEFPLESCSGPTSHDVGAAL